MQTVAGGLGDCSWATVDRSGRHLPCAHLPKGACGRPSSWISELESAESWPMCAYDERDSLTAWKLMTLGLLKAFFNSNVLDSKDNLCFGRVKHFFSSFFSQETPFQVSNLIFWSWLKHQAREWGFCSQAYANTDTPTHPGLFCYKANEGRPNF